MGFPVAWVAYHYDVLPAFNKIAGGQLPDDSCFYFFKAVKLQSVKGLFQGEPGLTHVSSLPIFFSLIDFPFQYFTQKSGISLTVFFGLADKIIDVVDTGNTLRANGLEPQELIAEISSRLIVNKASMKIQHGRIQSLIDTLREAVEAHQR